MPGAADPLSAHGLPEHAPVEQLQALTRVAAALCGTPTAVVNLLDETYQHQIADGGSAVGVTAASDSMCAVALPLHPALLVVAMAVTITPLILIVLQSEHPARWAAVLAVAGAALSEPTCMRPCRRPKLGRPFASKATISPSRIARCELSARLNAFSSG